MRHLPAAVKATVFCLGFALCAALTPQMSSAQLSTASPRIAGPVDESSLVPVAGTVPAIARAEFDQGEAAPSTQMTNVRLFFSRSTAQQADLDKLLADQIDPASPLYHQWITPQEFGRRFGPADSDIAAITAWLQSHGLKVNPLLPGRTSIDFSGTVAQLEEAFHTSIHNFQHSGMAFLSNTTEARIPSAIAPLISGIGQLNTIRPRPTNQPAGMGKWDPAAHALVPVDSSNNGARAEYTTGNAPNYGLYVVPADAATIYNTPNNLNTNFSSGTSYNGSGVKIGIAGDAVIQGTTVASYRTRFLGDSNQPTMFNVDGVTSTNDAGEAYIDTELAGGLAPGASIYYYTSTDLFGAIQKAVTDNTVDILSISFGECEKNLASSNAGVNTLASQAASQGITITVSTGDAGAAGCDNDNTALTAQFGLQVNGLASTPYNIAVGGTDYYGLRNGGFTTYVNTGSAANYGSAKGYIPESTWNDSTTVDGALANNVPYVNSQTSKTNIVGGGGGKSSCSTSTLQGCSNGYAKPSWQRGTGVPADGVRDIPDVSLLAGNGFDSASWLVCTDDTGTVSGVQVTANCTTQSNGQYYFVGFGGTSTSAPAFAGILALVEQKVGSRLGTGAAKNLYDLFNGAHASTVFHDITQGNISVLCTQGTTNCALNTAGNYFLTGYDTGAGYDLATGIGSVDATALISNWGSTATLPTPTIGTVLTPGSTITTNQALNVAVTVSGTSGTPTGTVTLTSGSYSSGAKTLTAGAYTFTIPAGSLAAGSDTLTINYSGDSAYGSASGTASVTVQALTATVALNASATAIVSNQSMTVKATVTGSGPTPTGTVTLSGGGYTSSAATLAAGVYTYTIPANSLTAGTDSLKVTYNGDNVYAAGANSSVSVVVTQYVAPTATITLTPAVTTLFASQSLSVPVSVVGSGPQVTGTVTLSSGTYTSSAATLASGAATITIPANSLAVGSDTIKATYSGDSNYASVNATSTVTVKAPYSMTPTAPAAISKGGSATSTITVSADASYTGTLALTCALTTSPAGVNDAPTCAVTSGASITVTAGAASPGTATVTITTTAAQASNHPQSNPWMGAGSGAVLALIAFLGIPARRRSWRNLLGLVVLLATLGSVSACGGGGGSTTTTSKDTGTTSGAYVFTVTATGTPAVNPVPTATINLTVN